MRAGSSAETGTRVSFAAGGGYKRVDRTYEERHGEGVEDEDEEELEVVCGVVSETSHPICATGLSAWCPAGQRQAHLHCRYDDRGYDTQW